MPHPSLFAGPFGIAWKLLRKSRRVCGDGKLRWRIVLREWAHLRSQVLEPLLKPGVVSREKPAWFAAQTLLRNSCHKLTNWLYYQKDKQDNHLLQLGSLGIPRTHTSHKEGFVSANRSAPGSRGTALRGVCLRPGAHTRNKNKRHLSRTGPSFVQRSVFSLPLRGQTHHWVSCGRLVYFCCVPSCTFCHVCSTCHCLLDAANDQRSLSVNFCLRS